MRLADYVMDRLVEVGIENVFLVNGRGMLFLSDALAKNKKLKYICTHHEQAAGFAAMGYASVKNNIGACMVSTGCASTNALTPVLCAFQDEIPIIFISGQNTLKETTYFSNDSVRTFGQQEANIVKIVSPITKYATMICNPNDIVYELDRALFEATNARMGPVWIDIPLDIQNARINNVLSLNKYLINKKNDEYINIDYLLDKINKSKRPILLLGNGCKNITKEIQNFVELINIPVVYERYNVNIYGRKNLLSVGAIGTMAANRSANMAIQNSDLVIAIGCRLDSMSIGDSGKFARNAKIIIIDIDETEIEKLNLKIDYKIIGNLSKILNGIVKNIEYKVDNLWVEKCLHYKNIFDLWEIKIDNSNRIDLYYLANCIDSILPDRCNILCDAGLEELIIPTNINLCGKYQKCIEPFSQGCMGYALPASYGAYCALNDLTIAIVGDGSIMMNLQELQTIKYNNLPIKIIICNNNCYSIIRNRQKELFRGRTIGNDPSDGISCPDFSKIAYGFGFDYIHINNSYELLSKLKYVLSYDGAIICEIDTIENQNYIRSDYVRVSNGKFVKRPLEDQYPFLPRELFLSEMIIEPIDQ